MARIEDKTRQDELTRIISYRDYGILKDFSTFELISTRIISYRDYEILKSVLLPTSYGAAKKHNFSRTLIF